MDSWLMIKGGGVLLCLIALILMLARIAQTYLSQKGALFVFTSELKILERKALDNKRSLIRFHDATHTYLVLLGGQAEQVLHKQLRIEKSQE